MSLFLEAILERNMKVKLDTKYFLKETFSIKNFEKKMFKIKKIIPFSKETFPGL